MHPKYALGSAWQPYVVAIALIVAAAAPRLWPLQALGVSLAWLTFYPAVMLAALYGGFFAGMLGTVLSCLAVVFFLPALVHQPFIKDSADWLGLVVFSMTCTLISGVAEAMHRARSREKQANKQLEAANSDVETANKELAAANSELAAANRELEAFSYSVSHDLRAPLRAIDGFSRILLEDYAASLDSEAQRYLNVVRDNAQQMGRLIDDLLAFSRLSRQTLTLKPVSPADIARRALATLAQEQDGRKVEIDLGDLPACRGDPALLNHVFVNLLGNALKYTRRRDIARIEIGFQAGDGENVYFVKDNGAGFDMRYAQKLFGVFQRLHRAEEFEGTGVGLAIVHHIIIRHGGRIWAEAAVDQGATFYFTLPAIERAAPAPVMVQPDAIAMRVNELV